MAASKAIITASDSGGPLEFVEDGKNGIVVNSSPIEIAKAIDKIAESDKIAVEMGRYSRKHLSDMNITWDNVVKELINNG